MQSKEKGRRRVFCWCWESVWRPTSVTVTYIITSSSITVRYIVVVQLCPIKVQSQKKRRGRVNYFSWRFYFGLACFRYLVDITWWEAWLKLKPYYSFAWFSKQFCGSTWCGCIFSLAVSFLSCQSCTGTPCPRPDADADDRCDRDASVTGVMQDTDVGYSSDNRLDTTVWLKKQKQVGGSSLKHKKYWVGAGINLDNECK